MNPDPYMVAALAAVRKHDEKERELVRARSRASQPRRRDTRKSFARSGR